MHDPLDTKNSLIGSAAVLGPARAAAQHTRREVVRGGLRLAFVVPVLSTFYVADARGAASGNQSCYPAGHACNDGGPNAEPCCNGPCNFGTCP